LYELLTGNPPFDAETWLEQGFDAMLKAIREQEPTPPSTRLTQNLVAASRQSEAGFPPAENGGAPTRGRYMASIDRDLDWIVLKALEKDRTRRYATANGFAADIQ